MGDVGCGGGGMSGSEGGVWRRLRCGGRSVREEGIVRKEEGEDS